MRLLTVVCHCLFRFVSEKAAEATFSRLQVALIYFMLQTSGSRHEPGWETVMIQCVSAGNMSRLPVLLYLLATESHDFATVPCQQAACTLPADVHMCLITGVLGFTLNHLVC